MVDFGVRHSRICADSVLQSLQHNIQNEVNVNDLHTNVPSLPHGLSPSKPYTIEHHHISSPCIVPAPSTLYICTLPLSISSPSQSTQPSPQTIISSSAAYPTRFVSTHRG